MAEISNGMGWVSPNNAALRIKSLQKKGYVTVRRGVSRGMVLTDSATVDIPDADSEEYWAGGISMIRCHFENLWHRMGMNLTSEHLINGSYTFE